jgi:hypothetical protein
LGCKLARAFYNTHPPHPITPPSREDSSELPMAYTNSMFQTSSGTICSFPVSRSFALQPEEIAVLPLHRGDMTLLLKFASDRSRNAEEPLTLNFWYIPMASSGLMNSRYYCVEYRMTHMQERHRGSCSTFLGELWFFYSKIWQ